MLVAVGMVVFALFAHRGMPWAVPSGAGLLLSAGVVGVSLRRAAHPRKLLGISGAGPRLGVAVIIGIGSGVAAGLWQRGQASVPHEAATGLPLFVLLACLIGIAEELVYRGWMLGRLSPLGWPVSVGVAAVAHAAYKTALFAWPPEAVTSAFDLGGIALWTVLGGLMLGGLRVTSGSVLPAMLAHAVFDAVVYSAYAAAPWWVWR
jgi:membrane protease YdiL (CAAX protease family)